QDFYSIRMVFEPNLVDPILIAGLPGIGNVGKLTADMLIRFLHAKCFAELYSPYFSNFVIVDQHGLSYLPRYEFYASPLSKPNVIILTGDTQPMFQYGRAYYEINDGSLDLVKKLGCKLVVTLGGIPSEKKGEIYVAATSKGAMLLLNGHDVEMYEGRIVGAAGLLPGLAKLRGLDAMSILVTTRPFIPDKRAASTLFKFIIKALGIQRVKI
ncbi:TPA: proteasome assembly chaperone family protein, partial [Candidatus Bathyarchaeota archaeon]|nr:proteasome assembly chaperone family protein [Candidatus Bathyarchaeota archaeon]